MNLNTVNHQNVELKAIEAEDSFLVNNVYQFIENENPNYGKQHCLITLYISLVQAVLESISSVSKDYRNLNNDFISKLVLQKINMTAKEVYGK